MIFDVSGRSQERPCMTAAGLIMVICIALTARNAWAHEVKDLKYGAVLFEFYQQKYFETLVEYDYADKRGGIEHHGDYPELLKGGVSLSYGLDQQARGIFTRLIARDAPLEVQNRAWYYLAKMLYLRGNVEQADTTLGNIHGLMPADIDQEYRYLAALVNIKMGYFSQAEKISDGFDRDGPYAPYLYFNLGVGFGKQNEYTRGIASLKKCIAYSNGTGQLARLADRAHMAAAYLYGQEKNFPAAYENIRDVSTTGVYSNQALLGAGWASINDQAYNEALSPLTVLEQRSIAIPEVQEAVLLVPHVYEKEGLPGRAAQGFISAYDRYNDALAKIERARESLKGADVLELFVRNMDELLGESDWFGTAPSVSLNPLSPFLLDLISDHSFQSVLKDLRDLYAIRNNLNSWKRKHDDFQVILAARTKAAKYRLQKRDMRSLARRQQSLQDTYDALQQRVDRLGAEDKERVQWMLDDMRPDIDGDANLVTLLRNSSARSLNSGDYAGLVASDMKAIDSELDSTNALISKVEAVMRELINAELDIHEERVKYYRVQAHLAKARILDRSLISLDDPQSARGHGSADSNTTPPQRAVDGGGKDAADAP